MVCFGSSWEMIGVVYKSNLVNVFYLDYLNVTEIKNKKNQQKVYDKFYVLFQ